MLARRSRGQPRGRAGRARPGRRGRDDVPHRDVAAPARRAADRGGARKLGRDRDARRPAGGDPRRRGGRRGRAAPSWRGRPRARSAAWSRSPARSTTSPTARPCTRWPTGTSCSATVTGTGCMSTAITGCFLGVRGDDPLAAATEALVAFGVAGEDAAKKAKGPGSFHVALYDALYDLDPKKLDSRAASEAPRDRRGPRRRRVPRSRAARPSCSCGARTRARTSSSRQGEGFRELPRHVRRQRRRRGGASARCRRRSPRP